MEKGFENEWKREFGFLDTYGMDAVYRVLVALAVSVADVGRLHRLLPDNCRLNHGKLINLCTFWRRWFRAERCGSAILPDEFARWVIPLQRGQDLTAWYASLLMDGVERFVWPCQFPFVAVLTDRGEGCFRAPLLGHNFKMGFAYLGANELGVELRLSFAQLTADFVPKLKQLPLRPIDVGLSNIESVCFCYRIRSDEAANLLIDGQGVDNLHGYHLHPDVRYVRQDWLLKFVQRALVAGGVPLTEISSYFDK